MKLFTILCLGVSGLMTLLYHTNQQDVFENSYLEALDSSQEMKKSLFLLFVSDECRICEDQQDIIERDKQLREFIDQSYESAIVNIDDFDGRAIQNYYNIDAVPSIVVVEQSGDIQWKHTGQATKGTLVQRLFGENPDLPVATSTERYHEPVVQKTVSNPHDTHDRSKPLPSKPIVSQSIKSDAYLPAFQVQYGFFGNRDNAQSILNRLHRIGMTESYIQEEVRNGKTFHRVLSPLYSTEQDAKRMLGKVKAEGIEGKINSIQ